MVKVIEKSVQQLELGGSKKVGQGHGDVYTTAGFVKLMKRSTAAGTR